MGAATTSAPADDIKASEISPSLGVNFADYTRTPEGLFYKDVVVGEGAVAGDRSKVTVAYRGFIADGTEVDKSIDFTFKMGSGQVIKGWQVAVPLMGVGDTFEIAIPANLGYGFKGKGPMSKPDVQLDTVLNDIKELLKDAGKSLLEGLFK